MQVARTGGQVRADFVATTRNCVNTNVNDYRKSKCLLGNSDWKSGHHLLPTELSDESAQALGRNDGDLNLSGLTTLSAAASEGLAKLRGDLKLNGLKTLSDAAAEALARHSSGELCIKCPLAGVSAYAQEVLARNAFLGGLWEP
jgi:hypothetical protein